ncbi:GST-like protein [Bradyrhizobium ottawaense]
MLEELLAAGHSDAEYDAWTSSRRPVQQRLHGGQPELEDSRARRPLDGSRHPRVRERLDPRPPRGAVRRVPATGCRARTETFNWLMWQMGTAPFVGGGLGHFYAYAPLKVEYAIDRYAMEVKRQLHVLHTHLAKHEFLAGDRYTIADMAVWPWQPGSLYGVYNTHEFLQVEEYPHLLRWYRSIAERPFVARGRIVNRTGGAPGEFLLARHDASDFDHLAIRQDALDKV